MNRQFKEKEIIMFSQGEYDDYSVEGVYTCLKHFCIGEKFLEWACETGRPIGKDLSVEFSIRKDKEPQLIEWLVDQGLIKRKQYIEIHLGDRSIGECSLMNMSED